MTCINLMERFGEEFQIDREDGNPRSRDQWMLRIVCEHGHIYPHGGEILGATTNHRGAIAGKLSKLPCVRVWQDGSDGVNALFDVSDFVQVAEIMKPKLRRRLSPQQKAAQIERLRKFQFSAANQSAGSPLRRDAASEPHKEAA